VHPIVGEIFGWEFLLVLAVIALLFGSTRIPKLARSIGQASAELRKGAADEDRPDPDASASGPTPHSDDQ
jgi:sec-independent protein translocase protein TatA